jgi:hypothetical protein
MPLRKDETVLGLPIPGGIWKLVQVTLHIVPRTAVLTYHLYANAEEAESGVNVLRQVPVYVPAEDYPVIVPDAIGQAQTATIDAYVQGLRVGPAPDEGKDDDRPLLFDAAELV